MATNSTMDGKTKIKMVFEMTVRQIHDAQTPMAVGRMMAVKPLTVLIRITVTMMRVSQASMTSMVTDFPIGLKTKTIMASLIPKKRIRS